MRFLIILLLCITFNGFGQISGDDHLDANFLSSKQCLRVKDYANQRKSSVENPSALLFERWQDVETNSYKTFMEPWENHGPDTVSGRIISIAFHPTDPNTFLVGAASGGLWKTTDYGVNWHCLTDDFMTMGAGAVAFNPQNPETILIATGEGYAFGSEFLPGFGCFISYDGGLNWNNTAIFATIDQSFAGMDINWNSNDTTIVNVSTSFGMYHSTDGGLNYSYTLDRIGGRLVADPLNPDRLYFTARYYSATYPGGLYTSTNAGASWTLTNNGLPIPNEFGYTSISIHPVYNNIIYLGISQSAVDGLGPMKGIYKSSNYGASFTEVLSNQDVFCYPAPYDNICQGWYDNTILVDIDDTTVIYAGGTRFWKSLNGGVDWGNVDYNVPQSSYYIHPDHHQTLFHPITGDLFDCNDGGVNYSSDKGLTWNSISDGLITHQFYSIAFAKTNPDVVIGGTQDVGTFTSTSAHSGSWNNDFSGDAFGHIISNDDDEIWYGTNYLNYQRIKTVNSGGIWNSINNGAPGDQWRMNYAMHPSNSDILLSSDDNFIYRTDNGGASWTAVSSPGFIGSLEFDQINPSITYARELWNDKIYKSVDGGLTWMLLSNTPVLGAPITDLEADPTEMNKIYATIGSFNPDEQLFVSIDGGNTWINISNDLPEIPTNTVAISSYNPQEIYVGNDFGVWVSENSGLTWEPFNDGLPAAVPVEDLHFYESDTTVRIGTYGRGYWKTDALGNIYADLGESKEHLNIYPNPSSGFYKLSNYLDHFTVYDQLGNILLNSYGDFIDLSPFPNGIYILKSEHSVKKLVKN